MIFEHKKMTRISKDVAKNVEKKKTTKNRNESSMDVNFAYFFWLNFETHEIWLQKENQMCCCE